MWLRKKKNRNIQGIAKDIHKEISHDKLLDIKFRIISGSNLLVKSSFVSAKAYNITDTEMWLMIPHVEVDGLHISFGHSNFVRNNLEIEFTTFSSEEFRVMAEVEWYELISKDAEMKFTVGVKFIKLTEDIKERLKKISSYLTTGE